MTETKQPLQSTTVWGGIASVLAGVSTLAMIAAGMTTPETAIPALVSIWAGLQTIWGRLRATTLIA